MPTLNNFYTIDIPVENYLAACSLVELKEIELLLSKYIERKEEQTTNENKAINKNLLKSNK